MLPTLLYTISAYSLISAALSGISVFGARPRHVVSGDRRQLPLRRRNIRRFFSLHRCRLVLNACLEVRR